MSTDLDDILASALDELDEEDEHCHNSAAFRNPPQHAAPFLQVSSPPDSTAKIRPAPTSSSEECSVRQHSCIGMGPEAAGGIPSAGGQEETAQERELRETITRAVEMLGRLDEDGSDDKFAQDKEGNALGDAFLSNLAKDFERLDQDHAQENGQPAGEAENDALMDSMVKQLLTKPLMYPPLKQVTDAFPAWLQEHRDRVDAATYQRHQEQYVLFREICSVYEHDEHNLCKLIDLMTKAQDYGQPPAQLVSSMAGEGEENLPGPILPNMMGLGFPGNEQVDPSACTIG